jgi:hypothetical protein
MAGLRPAVAAVPGLAAVVSPAVVSPYARLDSSTTVAAVPGLQAAVSS